MFTQKHSSQIEKAHKEILAAVGGEKVSAELQENTPRRAAKALMELLDAEEQFKNLNWKMFPVLTEKPGLVIVKDIFFSSLCEHHLLPFFGTVSVAYLPSEKIVGVSKIPRLVKACAHQLQLQERLTRQIATYIQEKLAPRGLAVVIKAQHACMFSRGARSQAEMVTSVMEGELKSDAALREEFWHTISR